MRVVQPAWVWSGIEKLLLLKTTNLACRKKLKLQGHVHKLSLRSDDSHSEELEQ